MTPNYLKAQKVSDNKRVSVSLDKSLEAYETIGARALLRLITAIDMKKADYMILFDSEKLLPILGMGDIKVNLDTMENKTLSAIKRQYHKVLIEKLNEVEDKSVSEFHPLFENIHRLAKRLNWSELDEEIFVIGALFSVLRPIYGFLYDIDLELSNTKLYEVFSAMTNQSMQKVAECFNKNSPLIDSKFINVNPDIAPFDEKLSMDNGFLSQLLTKFETEDDLLKVFFDKAKASTLTKAQFLHVDEDFSLCAKYLKEALKNKTKGVNVLIYGEPGTGKTEFAHVLSQELAVNLFEVKSSTEGGASLKGKQRFTYYQMTQKSLGDSGDSLIMFDEIEDVFPHNDFFAQFMPTNPRNNEDHGKAWINKVLENNKIPTIWITNSITQIDPAYLRRFDYSFELLSPPKAVRMHIANQYITEGLVSENWLSKLADYKSITPAQIATIAKVVNLLKGSKDDNDKIANKMLQNSLKLMNQNRTETLQSVTDYNINYINASSNINTIMSKLNANTRCSFCFYGVSGAGKTELAKHIASTLNKPLLVKRASDILGKYVGETEQNIAKMFEQAKAEDALLVLDEADSFLQDRQMAQRSWEITQVNELLTQMEAFNGIFICTTNLMDKLDDASLRRFTFKIKFDYLNASQRLNLFTQEYIRQGGDVQDITETITNRLNQLTTVTPGDFATIIGQAKALSSKYTAEEMINLLEEEQRVKAKSKTNRVGF